VAALRAVLVQVPDLPSLRNEGPDDLRLLLDWFFILLGVGFAVGVAGHLFKSRALVAAGIALIFVGTAAFLIAVGAYD
jgi:drug/metabolite transporter (DMT)-like permease